MSLKVKLKPAFWDHRDVAAGPYKHLFDFRRIWKLAVALTAGVAIVPLIALTVLDFNLTKRSVESEILMLTSRLVSNTWRTISFFMAEHKSALNFTIRDNTIEELNDPERLAVILENLKSAFGGFTDLGLIDSSGKQMAYVGPYDLTGKDYSGQDWFKEVMNRGSYISGVFLGFRNVPHMVIAVKQKTADGLCYVLRVTLDTERFNNILYHLKVSGQGDIFVVNHQGTLQTPSRYYGRVLEKISLPIPQYSKKTRVYQGKNNGGQALVIGYAYIPETPFILMIVKHKEALMKPWYITRLEVVGLVSVSVIIIMLVSLGVSSYLVSNIFTADQKRVATLHQVEYSNKMASLGRLAAGVAHEINNPLAIINERAGLIKDIFILKHEYAEDPKLIGLADSIISSVERCGAITKRLLNFARHIDVTVQTINLGELIREILEFLHKEAELKEINITVDIPDDIPAFQSDRGKLQQIFLNIINNAFAALNNGGNLAIRGRLETKDLVSVTFTDDGCGIPNSDLKQVFEPFFSTKAKIGGTGLGLSITYGLVQEIGSDISVESEVGKGTSFTVTIPLTIKTATGENDAGNTC